MAYKDRYQTILASIGDGVIVTDPKGCVAFMNGVAEDLTGWTFAGAEGKPITEVFHIVNETTRAPVENPVERVLREGRIVGLANHTILIRRDGSEIPIDDSGAPIYDSRSRLIGAVLVFRDIRERRAAEIALQASESRYAELFENANDMIYTLDMEGRFTSVNKMAEVITGYTRAELLGQPVAMLAGPDKVDMMRAYLDAKLNGSQEHTRYTLEIQAKDGRAVLLEISSRLISSDDGQPTGIQGIARDITERTRLQTALTQSEAHFRLLAENAQDIVYRYRLVEPRGYVYVSPAAAHITGYTPQEYYDDPLIDVKMMHPDDVDNFRQFMRSLSSQGDRLVTRVYRKDGALIYLEHRFSLTRDAQGRVISAEGIARDVTRRQREEERQKFLGEASTLLASSLDYEQTLKNVVALAVPRIAEWCSVDLFDEQGSLEQLMFAAADPKQQRQLAKRRAQLMRQLDRRDSPSLRAARSQQSLLLTDFSDETLRRAVGGDEKSLSVLKRQEIKSQLYVPLVLRGESLGVLSFTTTTRSGHALNQDDLALAEELARRAAAAIDNARLYREAQQAEAEQRRLAQQMRLMTDSLPVLIAYVDSDSRYQFNNRGYEEWFGLKPDEIKGRHVRDVLGVDAYERVRPHMEAVLKGQNIQYETEVPYQGAGARYINAHYVPDFDEKGQVRGYFSLVTDISERKRVEQQVYETNQTLRAMIDASPAAIAVFDRDGIVKLWSPAAERVFGWTADEAIGQFLPAVPPEKMDEFRGTVEVLLRGETIINRPARRRRKDGSPIDIMFSTAPLRDPGGRITSFVTVISDMTERLKAEAELQAAYARSNEILESIGDAFYALDGDWRFTYVNRRAEEEWNMRREDLLGKTIWEVFPRWDKTEGGQHLMATMQDRVPRRFETYSDYLAQWVSINIYPSASGISVYFRDITARKRIEEAIRESENRLRTVMENMPVILSVFDEKGANIVWNREAERVTGYSLEDARQPGFLERMYPDPALRAEITKFLKEHRLDYRNWELPTRCKDGSTRYISWSNVTKHVPVPGWADWAVGVDITERKLLELERERYYQAEKEARREAEEAALRIARLQSLTEALSRAATTDEVAQICVEGSREAMKASSGGLWLIGADGAALSMRSCSGMPDELIELSGTLRLDRPGELADAARTRQPQWFNTIDEYTTRYPDYAESMQRFRISSLAALPLMLDTQVIGVMGFSFDQPHLFEDGEKEFMGAFSQLCAQAMERARLYEAEQQARAEAEAARERLEFLTEASMILSATLDYEKTLQNVADLVVPRLADWFTVHLLEDGQLKQVVIKHKDPEKVRWGLEIQRRYPMDMNAPAGVPKVVRTGELDFYPNIPDELLVAVAQDEEALNILHSVGCTAVIVVPVISRGRVLGAMQLVSAESGRHYTESDLEMAKELAHRAGISIDKAQLYRAVREAGALAAALSSTALALNSTLQLPQVLQRILDSIEQVVPHDAASILLVEGDRATIAGTRGFSQDDMDRIDGVLPGLQWVIAETPILQSMADARQPIVIEDVQADARWVDLPMSKPTRAYLGVPITARDRTLGFLNLYSQQPGFFTAQHAERMQAFAAQAASAVSNAQLYAQAQELAAIEERQRLARDLHDAVTQMLFSSSMIAESLARLRGSQTTDKLWERIDQLARLNRGAHAEMRNLLLELRASRSGRPELRDLLEQLAAAAMGRTNLNIRVRVDGSAPIPPHVQAMFYRIAQETLNNVVKHARAASVEVVLAARADQVTLTIRDDGRGFDPASVPARSMGLSIMRERARNIDAALDIDSTPGQGTTVAVTWRMPAP